MTYRDDDAVPDRGEVWGSMARLRQLSVQLEQDLTGGAPVTDGRWQELAQAFDDAAHECRQQIRGATQTNSARAVLSGLYVLSSVPRRRPDLDRPDVARVQDWLLGGTASFALDQVFGQRLIRANSANLAAMARFNQRFITRAVAYALTLGVRQFVVLGCGLPTEPTIHSLLAAAQPRARCLYVDNDPVAIAHTVVRIELDGVTDRCDTLNADLRAADDIWTVAHRAGALDPTQPTALILSWVLHFLPEHTEIDRALGRYRHLLAPGSLLVATHLTTDGADDATKAGLAELQQLYTTHTDHTLTYRTIQQFTAFLDALAPAAAGTSDAPALLLNEPVPPGWLGAVATTPPHHQLQLFAHYGNGRTTNPEQRPGTS